MKTQKRFCLAIAVGFIVLFFWHICMYWGTTMMNQASSNFIPNRISIRNPKGLKIQVPAIKYYKHGKLSCYFQREDFFKGKTNALLYNIPSLIQQPPTEFEALYTGKSTWLGFVYDDTTRQFVVQRIESTKEKLTRKIIGYVGPKGYSTEIKPSLGTFGKPQPLRTPDTYINPVSHPVFLLYDPSVRRFYRIELDALPKPEAKHFYYIPNMDSLKITEGPVQNCADWAPVQIDNQLFKISDNRMTAQSVLSLHQSVLSLQWIPPSQTVYHFRSGYVEQYPGIDPNTMPDSDATSGKDITLEKVPHMSPLKSDYFVLHHNGRIDYLDPDTLNVTRCAGYLPEIGFYEDNKSKRPFDMADYKAEAFYDPNGFYTGIAVAAVSRDGFTMALGVYDAEGKLTEENYLYEYVTDKYKYYSGPAMLSMYHNGPLFLVIRYLLENLQSPLLRLLDIPAAAWISPQNCYNTLFVNPNSYIGLMKFDYTGLGFLLLMMLPSLAVSFWLGIKVRKKAIILGYDELSRIAWFIAVLAFGIPAYITFRLTATKTRMVTCANCGNLRRVEFENCQSCKRDWQKAKDLTTAPDWCVKDKAEPAAEKLPASQK